MLRLPVHERAPWIGSYRSVFVPSTGQHVDVAKLIMEQQDLVVRLSLLEKVGAFRRGDVRVPKSSVRDVRVTVRPFAELRGFRAPGTGVPGLIALGTWRQRGRRDFAAVY